MEDQLKLSKKQKIGWDKALDKYSDNISYAIEGHSFVIFDKHPQTYYGVLKVLKKVYRILDSYKIPRELFIKREIPKLFETELTGHSPKSDNRFHREVAEVLLEEYPWLEERYSPSEKYGHLKDEELEQELLGLQKELESRRKS